MEEINLNQITEHFLRSDSSLVLNETARLVYGTVYANRGISKGREVGTGTGR